MKKKLVAISVIVICLSLCIGGSYAYYTANATARNVITTGGIQIELNEKNADGSSYDVTKPKQVMPGSVVEKAVTVVNTGENPVWVRIAVEKAFALADETEGTIDLSLIELDLDTENWTEKDGFYYYNRPLQAGEETTPLFTTVTFNKAMSNLYQSCTGAVTVCGQAVQYANNGTAVLDAAGWPAP